MSMEFLSGDVVSPDLSAMHVNYKFLLFSFTVRTHLGKHKPFTAMTWEKIGLGNFGVVSY